MFGVYGEDFPNRPSLEESGFPGAGFSKSLHMDRKSDSRDWSSGNTRSEGFEGRRITSSCTGSVWLQTVRIICLLLERAKGRRCKVTSWKEVESVESGV